MKQNIIFLIYKTLLESYGPQGWWPITPRGRITPQYITKIKKSSPREALEISTGAILTQNTSWRNVSKAIEKLNRAGFFDSPFSFSKNKIASLIRSAGYYNQKSGYIRNFLSVIKNNYDGKINKLLALPTETLRETLLKIKGIGRETADSIILYAANKPIFVIDAYTLRILNRIYNGKKQRKVFTDYEKTRKFIEESIPRDAGLYNEFHALLVRLAKEHCFKKNPTCQKCPLSDKRHPQLCRAVS